MNALIYTLGWFAGVLLAANFYTSMAGFAVLFCICLIFFLEFYGQSKFVWIDLSLAVYSLGFGFVMETMFIYLGVVKYDTLYFPPWWILLLYPLFSTTFNHSLSFILKKNYGPLLLGLLAPLSYYAGASWGACSLPETLLYTYSVFAIGWVFTLYSLKAINNHAKNFFAS